MADYALTDLSWYRYLQDVQAPVSSASANAEAQDVTVQVDLSVLVSSASANAEAQNVTVTGGAPPVVNRRVLVATASANWSAQSVTAVEQGYWVTTFWAAVQTTTDLASIENIASTSLQGAGVFSTDLASWSSSTDLMSAAGDDITLTLGLPARTDFWSSALHETEFLGLAIRTDFFSTPTPL
ncbi:MAG: hypothetical protein WC505_06825 [Patescibacteria group bacterium]